MIKVMLADDDFPVLEMIHYAMDWESMGMEVIGMHENGALAYEAALLDMPDILITDIGMPQMNGLTLIDKLKAIKPNLRVAILSCHTEFDYARAAMRMQVQDYLLKDALEPAQIEALLKRFSRSLEEERTLQHKQLRMEQLVDRNISHMKEIFIRNTLQQPVIDGEKWKSELESFGLPLSHRETIIPTIGLVDCFRSAKQRFQSEDMLRFALDNVMEEAVRLNGAGTIHLHYDARESILLSSFQGGLKVNGYDEVRGLLGQIQTAVQGALKLSISFLIGDRCASPHGIKAALLDLRRDEASRFYRNRGSIALASKAASSDKEMGISFHQASEILRECITDKRKGEMNAAIEGWMKEAKEGLVSPEIVKDWTLKLLLDCRLKLQSALDYQKRGDMDQIASEVRELHTWAELREWTQSYCESLLEDQHQPGGQHLRKEIAEACQYVAMHLDKKITLEEVSERLFMNPSYFSRLFKKETGETFIEYVTRMKMHRAKELLDRTTTPVGKICETLGYDNQSYFIKLFKSFTGATPVEYRSQRK
ncbi:helix-turn-helix domain-containing protein [Paenibacillus sp. HB172176]|uniref:response regulator transcription factor n=1 Tax=Paenibacillus sp. HB172176 TaxID=2493690 RepID=UPI001438BB57|nr:helix-turn-helix domain-containing protein [Paenibacillus sp. HB172176]